MAKNPFLSPTFRTKPETQIKPAEHISFGVGGWSPSLETGMDEDCHRCLNGYRTQPGTVCGFCLRSDPETDSQISAILAFEGLPEPETPESLAKWLSLSPEEQFPPRRPIPSSKAA